MIRRDRLSIIAGLYGNALEWYDFLLYASFAPLFSKLFFNSSSHFISLLATFGVFAIGFLMRPLGGALLGYLADYSGRRVALITSVSLMSLSTLLIAFVPDISQIGVAAAIIFTFLRLLQGLAVGGELPGSATFLIEHMFEGRRGFAGSLVLSSAFLGIFAGSLVSSFLSVIFPYDFLLRWGWRFAYLLGGILGFIGIYLRVKSSESPAFLKQKQRPKKPVSNIFKFHIKPLWFAIMFTSILAMSNYLLIAYVTTFLVHHQAFSYQDALIVNFIALFLLTISIPSMGLLSDEIGRKPVFIAGITGIILFIFPLFALLSSGNWYLALIGQAVFALILAPVNATVPTIIAEMFPTYVRASGSSIGYNLGQAIFGGTLPLIALTMTQWTNSNYAPAWYILFWAGLVLLCTRSMQETYQNALI